MRITATLIVLALTTPAAAWEAGTDGQLCTLSHAAAQSSVLVTYDPLGPLYAITITSPEVWPDAPIFGLQFEGAAPGFISTDRHTRSPDGTALTVTDTGFGNVLAGLENGRSVTALTGSFALSFTLDGAAPEVAAFRACSFGGLT